MTKVEQVARAMWDERERQFPERVRLKFDPMPGDPIWPMARAAIAAMDPPTEGMMAAFNSYAQCEGDDARGFTAMIAEALEEQA